LFIPTAADTERLATVSRELTTLAAQCVEPMVCDQVHYTRGLVALFESREAAQTFFRRVTNATPPGPLAAPSALWLHLLDEGGVRWISNDQQESVFTEITAQFVREWIDRKLGELRNGEKTGSLAHGPDPAIGESSVVQSLQRQIRERDKRIAQLTSQLEALKVIDQDMDEIRRASRPPATLTPTATELRR
jgi:hypothetical protein